VDGDAGTRWSSAFADPQWLEIGLGGTAVLSQIVLSWEAAYGRAYRIEVSPGTGAPAITVADVDGVKVAGILIDAGAVNSPTLMEVGPPGSSADQAANPTSLHDVFFRIGGSHVGRASVSLTVNSRHVIGDHLWVWRADHGNAGTWGWTVGTGANGVVVNGDDVTMYGLFVEHYQEYQTIWNGNRGRTYFYQNETPYDPPSQAAWGSSGGGSRGWAAYKVADSVTTHEAWGVRSYCFFTPTRPSWPAAASRCPTPRACGSTIW
jgi:hypothetical protein